MKTLTNAWLCQFGLIAWKLLILHSFLLGVFSLSAATFTSIHSFNAPIFGDASNDGQGPQGIVLGKDGNFYGTTEIGGPGWGLNGGHGTVFRIAPDGTFTMLYAFNGPDGMEPSGRLVQGPNDSFYGITHAGGQGFDPSSPETGDGTIFKITADGLFTTVVFFDGTNGSRPTSLIRANDGNFYGTTEGGTPAIFKLTPDGSLTTLAVVNGPNWAYPVSSLIQVKEGDLYGITSYGGDFGVGQVIKVGPGGLVTRVVSFTDTNSGPPYSLMQASDGNLYGTTRFGGKFTSVKINGEEYGGYMGTIFKISSDGSMTNLFLFTRANGASPAAPLLEGTDGNFYGSTWEGGQVGNGGPPWGNGTLFKMSPQGKLTTLFQFNVRNGWIPTESLVQTRDGNFYGTTALGGTNAPAADVGYGAGEVFRLTVPGAESPKIVAMTQSGSQINLTWLSLVGRSYQLQSSTNLLQTNWNDVGSVVTATGTSASASDQVDRGGQRFYRIGLLP